MRAESVDLTDDDSIAALARWVGAVDHVLSTASARARDKIGDLDRDAVWRSFDTKLIGPLALTRALRNQINAEGSILTFPGCRGVRDRGRHARGRNHQGAADTLTRSLAIELAPITFDGSPTGRCPTQITLSHRGRAARVQPGTSRDVPRGATSAGLCASFSLLHEAVATRRPDTRPLRTRSRRPRGERSAPRRSCICGHAGGTPSPPRYMSRPDLTAPCRTTMGWFALATSRVSDEAPLARSAHLRSIPATGVVRDETPSLGRTVAAQRQRRNAC